MNVKIIELRMKGMTCDHCAKSIEKVLTGEGIVDKQVSYPDGNAIIRYDDSILNKDDIIEKVHSLGHYTVTGFVESVASDVPDKRRLVIIGGGSAAFAAGIRAHELGVSVTMINDGLPIGGTCVNVGCVPSKILIRTAEQLHRAQNSRFDGIETQGKVTDFKKIISGKEKLVLALRQEKYIDVVKHLDHFRVIRGRAKIVSPQAVEVNGETIEADRILIATGAAPLIPDIPGLKETPYLTNESAFELEKLPDSVIVLGGRYIALETAQLFSRLGSKVTVLQRSNRIIPTEETDITEALTGFLEAEGIRIVTGNQFRKVSYESGKFVVESDHSGITETFSADQLIVATGRKANSDGLGLENTGVNVDDRGFIVTDEYLRTEEPTIYAAGDILGENMFVYTAAYEGKLAVENAFSETQARRDYTALPWVIFTDPQLAGVGMDETAAREAGIDAETAVLPLEYVPRSLAANDTRGFIKLIRDKHTDKLIGARILAPEGGELIMEAAMAIRFGISVSQLREMFHPYLTLSEGMKLAAITFNKDVKELSCCAT